MSDIHLGISGMRVIIGDGGRVLKSNYPYLRARVVALPSYGSSSLNVRTLDGDHLDRQLAAASFGPGDEVLIIRVPARTTADESLDDRSMLTEADLEKMAKRARLSRTVADEYAAAHCIGDDPSRPE